MTSIDPMKQLDHKLTELLSMPTAELRTLWRNIWRTPAPAMGPDLLRRGIAWQLQSRVHGDLPTSANKTMHLTAERMRRGEDSLAGPACLMAGSRLVREWRGKTHHVIVLDNGFEHEGRRYSSLTQVASAITGVHWSGPVFFGLKKRSLSERPVTQ